MRVLLDENLPHDLIAALSGHEVSTVQGMGWAGVENGELLNRASGHTDAFITMDRKLERQQNLAVLPFGVVLIVARSNRVQDLLPLIPMFSRRWAGASLGGWSRLVPNSALEPAAHLEERAPCAAAQRGR